MHDTKLTEALVLLDSVDVDEIASTKDADELEYLSIRLKRLIQSMEDRDSMNTKDVFARIARPNHAEDFLKSPKAW